MSYLYAAPFLASAVGLVVNLFLFASVRIELRRAIRRERQRADQNQAEAQVEPVFIPVAPLPGLNIQRRTQVLRLLRHGQDTGHIAAALAIPRHQVELLIRGGLQPARAFRPVICRMPG